MIVLRRVFKGIKGFFEFFMLGRGSVFVDGEKVEAQPGDFLWRVDDEAILRGVVLRVRRGRGVGEDADWKMRWEYLSFSD